MPSTWICKCCKFATDPAWNTEEKVKIYSYEAHRGEDGGITGFFHLNPCMDYGVPLRLLLVILSQ